jgi:23S rRNA (cytidine1920-2'-O)/16S rRNA (cytidine1409-2'-O)-methyltransferase
VNRPQPRQRADRLLVERGYFETRARAQAAIEAGLVQADGALVTKASQMLDARAIILAEAPHPYVSRGGVKLATALDAFGIDPSGLSCLDIGASTGGFSDVLLRRGAAHVLAIDVGRDQLHASLHNHPRLTSREACDIRMLDPAGLVTKPSLIAIDVSFIALADILPAACALAAQDAWLIALVKPQFEVGRKAVAKGGIVKDEAARHAALEQVSTHLTTLGWTIIGSMPSPITGGDGNVEYLLGARRGEPA